MNPSFATAVMTYVTGRRMTSLGNLAAHFDCDAEVLVPLIRTLEAGNRLRLSVPRCQGSCSRCASCPSETSTPAPLPETTILISLDRTGETP